VRLTHLPTGIIVQCQNERSQISNRAEAMKMLISRLKQKEEMQRLKEFQNMYDEKGEIAWGYQIRSYVLHPYQLVKDHRTDFEMGNIMAVLDGDLDKFQEAYLRMQIRENKGEKK
jgi:peptide chain release factor 2